MPAGSSELTVRIRHQGSRTSIAVKGELDLSNKSVLRSHLDCVIADAPGDVELDLGEVSYIDSSSLAEILLAYEAVLDHGGDLRVTKASKQVARLFELCAITHLLEDVATPLVRSGTIASALPPGDVATRPVPTPAPGRVAS